MEASAELDEAASGEVTGVDMTEADVGETVDG